MKRNCLSAGSEAIVFVQPGIGAAALHRAFHKVHSRH